MKLDREQFSVIALCALRYCRFKSSYMTSKILDICRRNIKSIDYQRLQIMIKDSEHDFDEDAFDIANWQDWAVDLQDEKRRRGK